MRLLLTTSFKPRYVIKQFLPPNISTPVASELFREEAERLKSLALYDYYL